MEQKAFDLISEKVGAALSELGFATNGVKDDKDGSYALFTNENTAYGVLYNQSKKRFELRTCDAENEEPVGKWKSISIWLYDPEDSDSSDADSIANDFVETVQGPKRIAEIKTKKKRRKDEENNPDTIFFFNRFVGVFPELRDELNQERTRYGKVRSVTFTRSSLLPRIEKLCSQAGRQDEIKRCCDLLNDLYAVGDMDVRSIITIVILNGVDASTLENMKLFFSDDLKKSHNAAVKLKGKKIKPEKKKKPKKFVADNLNTLSR